MDYCRLAALRSHSKAVTSTLIPHLTPALTIQTSAPSYSIEYSNKDPSLLLASDESGLLTLLSLSDEGSEKVFEFNAHYNSIFDVSWSVDETRVMTASGDTTAGVWEVGNSQQCYRLAGHEASVKTIKNSPLWRDVFVTAGRDGMILFYDLRVGGLIGEDGMSTFRPVASTFITLNGKEPRKDSFKSNVTGLEFIAGGSILACALSNSPSVYFYDIRKISGPAASISSKNKTSTYLSCVNPEVSRFEKQEDEVVQSHRGNSWLTVSRDGSSLAVCSLNSCIYHYSNLINLDTQTPTIFRDVPTSFFTKPCYSPDAQFLACGSLNSCIYIWDVKKPRQSFRVHGHSREVNSVRWSSGNSHFLASCGDDECVLVWDYELSKV
mmetsp:Transcript_34049/g.59344  ORF Transcript_34049/g.59344 Transcript_34049/m.59344 type:complete len:380 (-) Transcript_34049:154-1293(-)|eukprot:CAMPEP_0204899166 /NCGR_PEP_ID=MMETSP1397-20131031/1693_1 /ASSEMBLY_ACC=CAM_ASM_000891 /TAXON_ID=49980 /ORGANISM="Climacostomum Climacostomum virens, Strain Stock W-24" /LENGTH=379 /DNA_ID=CAMNT_0052067087 /DNA_START=303 /DNA_END=1442 /DNA_ORIENTATION=+